MSNTLTLPNTFVDGTDALASEVNANFTAISTFVNSTKLNDDNIQTGGIGPASIASDAVTTIKILDANVTTPKIADASVTTAKIADGAVTQAKRAALGQQISASSGSVSTSSTTFTDVTNLSVSITTTGRPVMLILVADETTNQSYIGSSVSSAFEPGAEFQFVRGSTALGTMYIDLLTATSGILDIQVPPSCIQGVDVPAAGTYTYKLQYRVVNASGSRSAQVNYCKLVAYEL